MTHEVSERVWRKWVVPILMFVVFTTVVLSNDLRERHALRAACVASNQDRALQNVSNLKTRAFLMIASTARAASAASDETRTKREKDERTAALYSALADSYRHISMRACPALFFWQSSQVPDERVVLANALKPQSHKKPQPVTPQR